MNPPTQRLQDLDVPRRTTPVIPVIPAPLLSLLLSLDLHALRDLGDDLLDVKLQDPMVDVRRWVCRRSRVEQRWVVLHGDYGRWEFLDWREGVFVRAVRGGVRVSPVRTRFQTSRPGLTWCTVLLSLAVQIALKSAYDTHLPHLHTGD